MAAKARKIHKPPQPDYGTLREAILRGMRQWGARTWPADLVNAIEAQVQTWIEQTRDK